ncbi:MAG: hypothetical protein SVU32_09775, partial [Candidatus Nanohaloarchaea archaeon]|nr:hypothetical protein [Candidatus Nanohaloarchaea archaeon]
MNKGQGGIMQVMIAVLIVAILGLFLFVTQTSTTIENIEDVSATSQAFTAKQIGLSLYTTSF